MAANATQGSELKCGASTVEKHMEKKERKKELDKTQGGKT